MCNTTYCTPDKPLKPAYANRVQRMYQRPDPPVAKTGTIVSWIGSTEDSYTDSTLCLSQEGGASVDVLPCLEDDPTQQWRLANGLLRTTVRAAHCVTATGAIPKLGACDTKATRWRVTRLGQIATGGRCLTQDDMLRSNPQLHVAACTAVDPGQRWFGTENVHTRRPHRHPGQTLASTGSSPMITTEAGFAASAILAGSALLTLRRRSGLRP